MSESISAKLELIAALAKDGASKVKGGKYWPGDLPRDLGRMQEALQEINREIKDTAFVQQGG